MHLSRLILKNYRQFKFIDLDLSYPVGHPNEGNPLEKVCLIGKNGTGKTTLIDFICNLMNDNQNNNIGLDKQYCIKFKGKHGDYYLINNTDPTNHHGSGLHEDSILLYESKIDEVDWVNDYKNLSLSKFIENYKNFSITGEKFNQIMSEFWNKTESLLIFSPSEVRNNEILGLQGVPNTNLNNALQYFKIFPYFHNISAEYVKNFWNLVIYQCKKRESDYQEFFSLEKNKSRIVGDV